MPEVLNDPVLAARIQFAANITFHILFSAISIALTFAIGVVIGVTMSFQFGTNWPGYMSTVGNIAGPLLAYEVLTAFFLEATFLGVMLFGIERASWPVHLLATFLVAIGTSVSAFWILALNSLTVPPCSARKRRHRLRARRFRPSQGHRGRCGRPGLAQNRRHRRMVSACDDFIKAAKTRQWDREKAVRIGRAVRSGKHSPQPEQWARSLPIWPIVLEADTWRLSHQGFSIRRENAGPSTRVACKIDTTHERYRTDALEAMPILVYPRWP